MQTLQDTLVRRLYTLLHATVHFPLASIGLPSLIGVPLCSWKEFNGIDLILNEPVFLSTKPKGVHYKLELL